MKINEVSDATTLHKRGGDVFLSCFSYFFLFFFGIAMSANAIGVC